MLFNMSLHFHEFYLPVAVTLATAFVFISIIREKRDERKRA
jgi:hypothetical protein